LIAAALGLSEAGLAAAQEAGTLEVVA